MAVRPLRVAAGATRPNALVETVGAEELLDSMNPVLIPTPAPVRMDVWIANGILPNRGPSSLYVNEKSEKQLLASL